MKKVIEKPQTKEQKQTTEEFIQNLLEEEENDELKFIEIEFDDYSL